MTHYNNCGCFFAFTILSCLTIYDLILFITSPPEGVARYYFTLSVCVCVCVCVCVSVCPANILAFYFSAISRDIDLKFLQDTYRVVINSLKKKVKVTGMVHCFLAPLCHLAAELFKCRLVHRRRRRRQLLRGGGGGKGQSQKRVSNFFSFLA